jgi:hypothetical protein
MNNPMTLHDALKSSRYEVISSIINGREKKRLAEEESSGTTARMVALQRAQTNNGMLINKCIFFKNSIDPALSGQDDSKLIQSHVM